MNRISRRSFTKCLVSLPFVAAIAKPVIAAATPPPPFVMPKDGIVRMAFTTLPAMLVHDCVYCIGAINGIEYLLLVAHGARQPDDGWLLSLAFVPVPENAYVPCRDGIRRLAYHRVDFAPLLSAGWVVEPMEEKP